MCQQIIYFGKSDIRNHEEINNLKNLHSNILNVDGLDEEEIIELQRQIDFIKKMKNKK